MDVKQLKYFMTIVEEGSISAAARQLYMSQPPLSYQMKQLEEELDCTLFIRTAKSIVLTDEGKALYKRAKGIVSQLESTKEEIAIVNKYNRIRIGVVSSVVDQASKWLAHFKQQNEKVMYEIYENNTYSLLDMLNDAAIDLAIVREPYIKTEFEHARIVNDYLVAVNNDDYQLKDYSMAQLAQHPLIIYRRWKDIIYDRFNQEGLEINCVCLNDDARTSLTLAKNGLGIALVPHSCTEHCDLHINEVNDLKIESYINVIYEDDNYKNNGCQALIDYLCSLSNER